MHRTVQCFQSEIGYFSDVKATKKMQLDASDQKQYENWDFCSQAAFQEELVEFLTYEEIFKVCL